MTGSTDRRTSGRTRSDNGGSGEAKGSDVRTNRGSFGSGFFWAAISRHVRSD